MYSIRLMHVTFTPSWYAYSPNSLRTLLSTLSFSGSYGWSFEGISSSDGKACV